jgi:dihydrofolate reductase
MSTLALVEFVTLDGVMQGFANDDPEGGFRYGGWGQWHPDPELAGIGGQGLSGDTAYLFGRRTYQEMIGFWPHQPDNNPMAANLNAARKYLVSRTLTDPTWHNTTVLHGELEPSVRRLKQEGGDGAITVLGSGRLARELLRLGLVDQVTLFVHPLLLGQGQRLFGDLDGPLELELTEHQATSTGNLVLTYRLRR